jgi:hypothetical protein
MSEKPSSRARTGVALLIMLTLTLLALSGMAGEQPLLAAGCCEDCDPAYQSCLDDCSWTCGGDQTCYSSCQSICFTQLRNCLRGCFFCGN